MLDADKGKHEEHMLCPTNPYAATKASAEMLVMSYYHSFGIPAIITRSNNVFGYNQHEEKLIPRFIKLLKEGEKLTIQGDGSCVRNFLWVDDVIDAFSIIISKGVIGEIYNIAGPEENEWSVLDIAKELFYMTSLIHTLKFEDCITYVEDRPFNDKRYFISSRKLTKLGWKPKMPVRQGLSILVRQHK